MELRGSPRASGPYSSLRLRPSGPGLLLCPPPGPQLAMVLILAPHRGVARTCWEPCMVLSVLSPRQVSPTPSPT